MNHEDPIGSPIRWHTYALAVPGFIKVGKATNVARRVCTIQAANPHRIELLGFVRYDIELKMHRVLVDAGVKRVRGEWFEDTPRARVVLAAFGLADAE